MNILITKTDTVRFGQMTNKKITWGGFDVTALMFIKLALAYPEHTFYFIGTGDINKSTDLPPNIVDLSSLIKDNVKTSIIQYGVKVNFYTDIYDYIDSINLHFDKAIVWFCRPIPLAEYNNGYISERTGTVRKLLASEINQTQALCVCKHYNIPTYYIIDDLMEMNKITADMHDPICIFSQRNGIDRSKHFISLNKTEIRETPIKYKEIEKLWLQGKEKVDWRNFEKKNRFILTVNGGPYKAKYIKKWIINQNPNELIYGNWETSSHIINDAIKNGIKDNCKKVGMTDMEDLMFDTRYTFVIPPQPSERKSENTNFVTQKVFSMLYYGIIPFWCPDDYDSQNLYNEFPDYIKVKSPEDLYNKMDELDNNPEKYRKLLYQLYEILDDSYFDERFIHKIYDEILSNE